MIGVRLTICKMPILITPITSRQFIGFHPLSSFLSSSSPSSAPLLRWRFVWFSRLHYDPSYLFLQRTPTYRRERAVKPGLATDSGPWLFVINIPHGKINIAHEILRASVLLTDSRSTVRSINVCRSLIRTWSHVWDYLKHFQITTKSVALLRK